MGRELLGSERSVGAKRLQDAGGGRPQPGGGRVGQLGQGAVVGAAEVVPRHHRAGALLHSRATALPRAAAGAGEQESGGIAAGWEPAADRVDHLGREGDLADAGVALGAGLEAAAELAAGLIAHVDDLQGRDGLVEVDAAAVQAGKFADALAGAEQGDDVIPPEQGKQASSWPASSGVGRGVCRAAGPRRGRPGAWERKPCGPGVGGGGVVAVAGTVAVSGGQGNASASAGEGVVNRGLSRAAIQLGRDGIQVGLVELAQVAVLGQVLAEQAIGFSLRPRCQGLRGSQKDTWTPVSTVNLACSAISLA